VVSTHRQVAPSRFRPALQSKQGGAGSCRGGGNHLHDGSVRIAPERHNGLMEIPDTLGFLLGTWDLSRSYTDHRSGTTAALQGQAVLATDSAAGPDRAQYEETGRMCLGSHQGNARRSLEPTRITPRSLRFAASAEPAAYPRPPPPSGLRPPSAAACIARPIWRFTAEIADGLAFSTAPAGRAKLTGAGAWFGAAAPPR
jgi:Family of unknown function (DUF6314)